MNNQSERRTSKRLAGTSLGGDDGSAGRRGTTVLTGVIAAADYEQDDDFQFVRKSKRAKTEEPEPAKKPARGRGAAKERASKDSGATTTTSAPATTETITTTTATRKPSRRKPSVDASQDEPPPKVTKKSTRRSTRLSSENGPEEPETNGAPRSRGRPKGKPTRAPKLVDESPPHEQPVKSAKIALPMSDTPIINRNKEMRKKGNPNRRSSLGTRGRRASSLIESGQSAIPHRDVDPAAFYKHIEAEGLTEPRRMKQLLTWCGERSLSEKPPHGTPNSNAILGGMENPGSPRQAADANLQIARAIQDQILKDFGSRSNFSDWFSRDDLPAAAPVVLKPNPRNTELDAKMTTLEEKIRRYVPHRRVEKERCLTRVQVTRGEEGLACNTESPRRAAAPIRRRRGGPDSFARF